MKLLIPDLIPGTNYAIQVRARAGDSASEWSNRYDIITSSDITPPDVPAWEPSAWMVDGDTFVASWAAVDQNLEQNKDFDHYELELDDTTKQVVVRTTNTNYTLTFDQNRIFFTTPKATVKARVRSVDQVGNVSAWNTVQTASNPAPSSPGFISATPIIDSIKLEWEAVSDIDVNSYKVQKSTTSGSTGFTDIYNGPNTNFTHYTIQYNTDHWYRVYAVDKFGTISSATTSPAVRPKSSFAVDTVAPDVPTGLAATLTNNANGLGSRASLSWNMVSPPSDLAGFYVRYRRVGDTNYSMASFNKDDRNGVIDLQVAYVNYEFQIKAFDWSNNESAWSATVTANAPGNTPPGQTVGLAAVAGRDSIRYTWTPSTEEDLKEYEVTFSTSSTFASGNITFKTGTAAYLDIGGLTAATTYYARVRAIDTAGAVGAWSTTNTTATLAQLTPDDIGAPTDTEFTNLSNTVNGSIKSYVTEYSVNSSETVAPTTGWSTATPTRTPGSFIWYRVTVTYNNNTTSTTNPALLTGNTGATGSQGIQGPAGADGTSLYTWLKYADTPTTGMSDDPTGKTYIGLAYNKASSTESTNYADYTWSLIKGADGADGVQGPPGADGQTTYTWVKYADNASGGGMSDSPTGKTYIGLAFNKTTATESTTATDYQWSLIQGPQGNTGATGVSVTSITPYFAQVTTGAAAPAKPTTATPAAPWVATEPGYVANTELYRTEKISFSDATFTYTTVSKVSSYTAATTAITAANGKNKIIFSTGDATGTNYADGDVWYKRDGSGVIIATWEFTGGAWVSRTFGDATLNSLNVGKLVSGNISAALIKVSSTGAVQSSDYSAGSLGWKLSATGLEVNKGSVKASALIGDTIGSSTGTINVAAGAALVLNGGYLKSNTYTGSDQTTNPSNAGFYLGNDGIRIDTGKISAAAFSGGSFSTGTITMAGGSITGGGWTLNSSGLTIPNGAINAGSLNLQVGSNIMPPLYADFEAKAADYTGAFANIVGGVIAGVSTSGGIFGPACYGGFWASQASNVGVWLAPPSQYNIAVEPGKTYIFSGYAWSAQGVTALLRVEWSNGVQVDLPAVAVGTSSAAATRLSGVATVPAGIRAARLGWVVTTQNLASSINVDGFQVEEKSSNSNTPSTWKPPVSTSIVGGQIKTGSIQSSQVAKVWDSTLDSNGYPIGIKDDPDGKPAWSINTQGNAQFGDVMVNGNLIVGRDTIDNTKLSTMTSGTYIPGEFGWTLRSDGSAELRSLDAESLHGSALIAGTVAAEALTAGTVTADLSVAGVMEAAQLPTEFSISTTSGSTTIVLDTSTGDAFQSYDVGVTIIAEGIPNNATIVSITNDSTAVVSAAATATASDVLAQLYRGRRVRLSGSDGIAVFENDGTQIISMPTDSSQPNRFTGDVVATSITVQDDFRMYGLSNSMGQGSKLDLEPGTFVPPKSPTISFSYNSGRTYKFLSSTDPYKMKDDGFMNTRGAPFYDPIDNKVYIMQIFYGNWMFPLSVTGNLSNATLNAPYSAGEDITPALYGTTDAWCLGGAAGDATYFYFLTENQKNGEWRVQRISRANVKKSGGPVAADRISTPWTSGGDMLGKPAMFVYNNYIYIAKIKKSTGTIALYKYAVSGMTNNSPTIIYESGVHVNGSVANITVGKFDYSTGSVYMMVNVDATSPSLRKNYLFRDNGTTVTNMSWGFPTAKQSGGSLGTHWMASSTDDSTGVFVTILDNSYNYIYTRLQSENGNGTMTASQQWRNNGSGGGVNAVGPMGPVGTYPLTRRAKLTIASQTAIPSGGIDAPNSVTFYMSSSPSGTRYRYPGPGVGVTKQTITEFLTTDASGTTTPMAAGVPSKITAGSVLEINGNGLVSGNTAIFSSGVQANNLAGNRPALIVGNPSSTHLRIDGNEIYPMGGDTTNGTLYIRNQVVTDNLDDQTSRPQFYMITNSAQTVTSGAAEIARTGWTNAVGEGRNVKFTWQGAGSYSPNEAGIYVIAGVIGFQGTATANVRADVTIMLNGSPIYSNYTLMANRYTGVPFSLVRQLATTDVISVTMACSGANLVTTPSYQNNVWTMYKVGPYG